MIKFIHTSDIHLGAGFNQFSDSEKRKKEQIKTFEKIVNITLEKKADLFLLSGDLFNSISPKKNYIELVKRELSRLLNSGISVFIVPGNHDYYIPDGLWDSEFNLENENLFIFKEPEFTYKHLEDINLSIIAKAYDKTRKNKRLLDTDLIPETEGLKIIIFHGSYDNPDFMEFSDHPFSLDEINKIDFNYLALGHYHKFGILLDGKDKKAVYPGTPEALKFSSRESGSRFIIYGEIEESGKLKIEPLEIQTCMINSLTMDITSYDNIKILEKKISEMKDENLYLNLKLTGTPSIDVFNGLEQLTERFSNNFAELKIDITGVDIPAGISSDERYILGRFVKKINDKLEETSDDHEKIRLKTALRLVINKTNK
ncbi:exonuclease SbcCD subunit D [candidate division KSB1 bacterium]